MSIFCLVTVLCMVLETADSRTRSGHKASETILSSKSKKTRLVKLAGDI